MLEQRLRVLDCIALFENYRDMLSERCGSLNLVLAKFTGMAVSIWP